MFFSEAEIHVRRPPEALHQQSRAVQQYQRQRHLGRYQQPRRPVARRDGSPSRNQARTPGSTPINTPVSSDPAAANANTTPFIPISPARGIPAGSPVFSSGSPP